MTSSPPHPSHHINDASVSSSDDGEERIVDEGNDNDNQENDTAQCSGIANTDTSLITR